MAGSKRNKLKKLVSPSASNDDFQPKSAAEDDDLVNDLLAQLDSRDGDVQKESAQVLKEMQMEQHADRMEASPPAKQDAKSRYKARQARKAAQLAEHFSPDNAESDARLRKEAEDEERIITKVCDELNLKMHEINPDGHCLYSAIADQLSILGIIPSSQANYATTRLAAANYIYSHPDDFIPFLPSAVGEDGAGATDAGLITGPQFEEYCGRIRDTGTWGGEPEILALSRAFNVPIHVVQGGTPPIVEHTPSGGPTTSKPAVISYHRRMYGLGEHYNSLRPRSGLGRLTDAILG